ncbi:hypothetical protein [Terrarubrum flagellatum]|uniref:hypothetical protein n=1 Tax=Terrirubrum flagellatum TaxID=2895980 RepID=UPI00314527AA
MSTEPDNLVLTLLREMRANMATKDHLDGLRAELKSDIAAVRAEMATKADLASLRKELSEQIVGLRRQVVDYHSSVVGHGVIISEPEARLRRVEQHLNLPPAEAH